MLLMSLGLPNVLDVKICLGLLLISLLIFDFWKSKNAPNFPPGPCDGRGTSFNLISFTCVKEEITNMLSEAIMIFLMSIFKSQTGAVQPWGQRSFCQHSVYVNTSSCICAGNNCVKT